MTAVFGLFQCDWFFSGWDADCDVPDDQVEEGAMPVSGMNQELLTKAEHLGKLHSLHLLSVLFFFLLIFVSLLE